MNLLFMLSMLFSNTSPVLQQDEKMDAVDRVVEAKSTSSISPERKGMISNLIRLYSKTWHVDPLLVACVAAYESNFRDNPPGEKVCRTEIKGGKAIEVCKTMKREEGIMQSMPNLRVTKDGFWYCFGPTRKYSRQALRATDAGICVGVYELSARRLWVRRWAKIYARHDRHKRYIYDLRKDNPNRAKELVEMFWTAGTYNWGPRILRYNKGRWDSIGYPIRIMRCYLKYSAIQLAESKKKKDKGPASQPQSDITVGASN